MIITSTPLRVSFFGGGTDYPVWYREHGGAVLSTAIDKSLLHHLPVVATIFRVSQSNFLLEGRECRSQCRRLSIPR